MSATRKAVVFGATSAIAQQVIRLLATQGAEVVLVGRDPERLAAVAADALARGARGTAVAADLDDTSRHEELVAQAATRLGRIDLVIVAQGLLGNSDACDRDPELAPRLLAANFTAPALLLERVAARLAAQGSGTIVGISSVAGDRGRQSNYVYGAAKGGWSIYLEGLRNRLHRAGVRVVTVKPGFVDSPMTAAIPKTRLFVSPSKVAAAILRAIDRRRDVVYVPGYWRFVMCVIRHVPGQIFNKLRL